MEWTLNTIQLIGWQSSKLHILRTLLTDGFQPCRHQPNNVRVHLVCHCLLSPPRWQQCFLSHWWWWLTKTHVQNLDAYFGTSMSNPTHVNYLVSTCFYQLSHMRAIRRSMSIDSSPVNSFINSQAIRRSMPDKKQRSEDRTLWYARNADGGGWLTVAYANELTSARLWLKPRQS